MKKYRFIGGFFDEDKLDEFLINENIKCEKYFSWWDIFCEKEAKYYLYELEVERFKKLSKKNQKLCLEDLMDEICISDNVVNSVLIRDLTEVVLSEYEEKDVKDKRKKKKKRKKNKDSLKHIKIKRIK